MNILHGRFDSASVILPSMAGIFQEEVNQGYWSSIVSLGSMPVLCEVLPDRQYIQGRGPAWLHLFQRMMEMLWNIVTVQLDGLGSSGI